MTVDGVEVNNIAGVSETAVREYIKKAETDARAPIHKLTINPMEGGKIALEWELYHTKFERIRRITGKPIWIARKVA